MNELDYKFFDYLKEKGFNERWFLLASVQNLLLYVASGFSNEKVADMIGLDKKYVDVVCKKFLEFEGWEEDLDYSPWYKYKNDLLTIEENYDIMVVCQKYADYRKELDDYYERDEIA